MIISGLEISVGHQTMTNSNKCLTDLKLLQLDIVSERKTLHIYCLLKSAVLLYLNINSAELFEFRNPNIEVSFSIQHFSVLFKCRYRRKMHKKK